MNDRRDFLTAGAMSMLAMALSERGLAARDLATVERLAVSERMVAERDDSRVERAPTAKQLAQRDTPAVNLEGWQMTASEVSYPPGDMSGRHRHPGFVIGYVLEGQYLFAVNEAAPATLSVGQMFFESFDKPGEVHAVSGNASKTAPCRILAIVFTKKGDPVTIPG